MNATATAYVILLMGFAGDAPFRVVQYLKTADVHAVPPPPNPQYPSGTCDSTTEIAEAMRFDTREDAWAFYTRQSHTVPYRPDGKVNRPLLAFDVAIVEARA